MGFGQLQGLGSPEREKSTGRWEAEGVGRV